MSLSAHPIRDESSPDKWINLIRVTFLILLSNRMQLNFEFYLCMSSEWLVGRMKNVNYNECFSNISTNISPNVYIPWHGMSSYGSLINEINKLSLQ